MASGFVSNYKQNGYSLSTTWYNSQNVGIIDSSTVADIYTTTQRTGIFMIDGVNQRNGGTINTYYPVTCSANNLINIGLPTDVDDAWLVYPGYGFTLYYDYYGGITSRNYVNTSSVPVVYYCGSTPGTGWVGQGTPILTTGGSPYAQNQTNSIRIYFRGTEIRVSGIA
jgi:hypothetical protein